MLVVVNFLFQLIFIFPLFLGMVMLVSFAAVFRLDRHVTCDVPSLKMAGKETMVMLLMNFKQRKNKN